MGRRYPRRREPDLIEPLIWTIGVLAIGLYFLAAFSPGVRLLLSGIPTLVTWLAIIAVLAAVGLGVFFLVRHIQKQRLPSCRVISLPDSAPFEQRPPLRREIVTITADPPGAAPLREPSTVRTERESDEIPTVIVVKPIEAPRTRTLSAAELVERLRSIDWFQFEQVVALAYEKKGCRVLRRGGANPDGGIDLIVNDGRGEIAVQCKHWKAWKVGIDTVWKLLGALNHAKIDRAILVTLKVCTHEAERLAAEHHIEIVNENELAEMLLSTKAASDPMILAILADETEVLSEMRRRDGAADSNERTESWLAVLGMLKLLARVPGQDSQQLGWIGTAVEADTIHCSRPRANPDLLAIWPSRTRNPQCILNAF